MQQAPKPPSLESPPNRNSKDRAATYVVGEDGVLKKVSSPQSINERGAISEESPENRFENAEAFVTDARELLNTTYPKIAIQIAEYESLNIGSSADKEVPEAENFNSENRETLVQPILANIDTMIVDIDVMEESAAQFSDNEDAVTVFSALEDLKSELQDLKAEIAFFMAPEDLALAQNQEELDLSLDNWAEEEDDAQKKADRKIQVERLKKAMLIAGIGVGMTLDIFFEKGLGDFKAFVSFVLNPSGGHTGGYEHHYNSSAEEKQIAPYHSFMTNFRKPDLVGRAIHKFTKDNADAMGISGWHSDNEQDLLDISQYSDSGKVYSIMLSFYDHALKPGTANYDRNWNIFRDSFASELFGGNNVGLDDESIQELKELFKNDAEGLKKLWKIKDTSTEDSTEPEPEPELETEFETTTDDGDSE